MLAAGLLLAATAGAEGPAEDAAPRPVSLDSLLRLPPSSQTKVPEPAPEVGGATRREWSERFDRARGDVAAAEARLAEAQAELEQLAQGSESWQVSAPGVGGATPSGETGPLSFAHRQEIRRAREDVQTAQQALEELRIEANLAGVPPEWIGGDEPVAPPQPNQPLP